MIFKTNDSEVNIMVVGTKKKEFQWKKFLWGLKRPFIACVGFLIATLAVEPQWAWVGGLSAERIWSTVEFYIMK